MKQVTCILLGLLLTVSCGIFSPRPVENPVPANIEDPFSFALLKWGADKKFSKLSYQELFDETFVYYDINNNSFEKDEFTQHLRTIQSKMTIKTASWNKNPALVDIAFSDTAFLLNRIYNVSAEDSVQQMHYFEAKTSLKVIANTTKNTWVIVDWKDESTDYSIFHPYYLP